MIDTIMATTTDFFNTTGKRIGIMRKQRGLSQTELADNLQVARSYISQMESDRREPSLKVFAGLVEQLQTSADYLLLLSDDPDRSPAQAVERYISPEADSAAELIDALPPMSRSMILGIARIVAEHERQRTEDDFGNLLGYVESVLGRVARQQVEQAMIVRRRGRNGTAT